MDIEEYMTSRVDDAIEWYDKRAYACQKNYKRAQTIKICIAALIPLLSGYAFRYFFITYFIGAAGAIITIIESITQSNRYHENWIEYRSTCELLKYQKHLFLTRSAPYTKESETIENLFVKNVEQLISSENNQWKKIMNFQSSNDKDGKPV
jgi:hypothetical protein